jgi:uncharacterized protein
MPICDGDVGRHESPAHIGGKQDGDQPVNTTATTLRDHHLFSPGPKRLLALDGGGVRGAITVAFLEQIEAVLCKHLGKKEVHLGDWFDLVGGTSTGAIIAGALALGYSIKDVTRFYKELAPKVFCQSWWRLLTLQPKFDADALRAEIKGIVGDISLDTDDLITGLCVVSKRIDTGSPWILANNPRAPYWEANRKCKLGSLVRASTAAPFYFEPEPIVICDHPKEEGTFIDGGVTPHNNPSLVLLLMTILKPYNICWEVGPDKLTVVSIGTGSFRNTLIPETLGFGRTARLAIHALTSMMNDAQSFVLQQMQYLGECPAPWWINSEIGSLAGDSPPNGKLFRFLRYDVRLELSWIEKELGREQVETAIGKKLTPEAVARMRHMDDPDIIPDIYELAKVAAAIQVKPEHWIGELPGWCDGMDANRPKLKP